MLRQCIARINAAIVSILQVLTALVLIIMTAFVFAQIVLRYFFKMATPWAEEGARIAMIWIVFLGAAGMLIKGEHLFVDVFYSHFNIHVKRVLRIVYDAAILAFVCVVLVYAVRLISTPMIYRAVTPILEIPMVVYYLSMPISMALMAIFEVGDIIEGIACLRDEVPPGEKEVSP